MAVFDRIATSSEPGSYVFSNINEPTVDCGILIVAIQGANVASPRRFVTQTLHNTSEASPITIGADGGTAVAGDCLVYWAGLDKTGTGAASHAAPTDYVEKSDNDDVWISMGLHVRENAPGGATGTINSTATTAENAGWGTYVVCVAKP